MSGKGNGVNLFSFSAWKEIGCTRWAELVVFYDIWFTCMPLPAIQFEWWIFSTSCFSAGFQCMTLVWTCLVRNHHVIWSLWPLILTSADFQFPKLFANMVPTCRQWGHQYYVPNFVAKSQDENAVSLWLTAWTCSYKRVSSKQSIHEVNE